MSKRITIFHLVSADFIVFAKGAETVAQDLTRFVPEAVGKSFEEFLHYLILSAGRGSAPRIRDVACGSSLASCVSSTIHTEPGSVKTASSPVRGCTLLKKF